MTLRPRAAVDAVSTGATAIRLLAEAGIIRPIRPDRLLSMVGALRTWGLSLAAGADATAAASPRAVAIVDERGSLTYAELRDRTNALAHGLRGLGVKAGDNVGILCRNHCGFVETTLALGKVGANALLLNTSFAAPQLREVNAREGVRVVVHDREFSDIVGAGTHVMAWTDGEPGDGPTVDGLIASNPTTPPPSPSRTGRQVILTSGTTGTPKGATRPNPRSLEPVVGLLSRIPVRASEPTVIAAPMFHAWGFAHMSMALALGSTMVVRRTFDPEATLAAVARHRATMLVVVPVMLQRIMALPADVRSRHDTASLRVIATSGSALPGALGSKVMDAFGDVLYNLYGSTEVAWASIATPADLRAAPGTAGRPPLGTVVRLLDEDGNPVGPGGTGRIFVGNDMLFEGYTGGEESKEVRDGLMSTGDVGHFDDDGRLFVEGRADDMIVSGGENVFPEEVESLLSRHEGVADVAVVGVDDEQYGQRLKAFVVRNDGHDLSEEDVKGYVRQHLARYKVPRDVEFLAELPRNATGKILRRQLK